MAPIPSIGVGAENASTVLLLLKLAIMTSKQRRKKDRISFLFVVCDVCLVSSVCRWRIEVSNNNTEVDSSVAISTQHNVPRGLLIYGAAMSHKDHLPQRHSTYER